MVNYIYILAIVCGAWVIYDVWAVNTKLGSGAKMIWTIFAFLFSIVTAIVYFFIGRK